MNRPVDETQYLATMV